jgi:hypothetical protein
VRKRAHRVAIAWIQVGIRGKECHSANNAYSSHADEWSTVAVHKLQPQQRDKRKPQVCIGHPPFFKIQDLAPQKIVKNKLFDWSTVVKKELFQIRIAIALLWAHKRDGVSFQLHGGIRQKNMGGPKKER